MSKGERTRTEIIDKAISLAAASGLEAVSIGVLASETGLSKSGLFAHFKSKEALQLDVLDEIRERFAEAVFQPALQQPKGEPRVRAFFEHYLNWIANAPPANGCIVMALSYEYDDRPGAIRDRLLQMHREFADSLVRIVKSAVETGDFSGDLNPEAFAFEVMGIEMAYQYRRKFLRQSSAADYAWATFDALLKRSRSTMLATH